MIVPLSTSAATAVPQGNLRRSLLFLNVDGAINIYLKKERPGSTSVTSSDFDVRIAPGGSFSLNTNDDGAEAVQERWTAIAASGTPNLCIFETKDLKGI